MYFPFLYSSMLAVIYVGALIMITLETPYNSSPECVPMGLCLQS